MENEKRITVEEIIENYYRKSQSKDVVNIVKEYLEKNGYDGLCNEDCGCGLSDLAPCIDDFYDCRPGYKINCDHSCKNQDAVCYSENKEIECPYKED